MVSLEFLFKINLPAALWPLTEMSWLRHWATSRKVAGSIPDCVIEILIDIILPAALWSLTEMSWLRHWPTSRKVAGSIPDCVIGIFH